MSKRFLFVLHSMGILDHAAALKSQILKAGGEVSHVVVGENQLPGWAEVEFSKETEWSETDAIENLETFNAVWLQLPYEELRPIEWRGIWERVPVVYSGYGIPLSNWKTGLFELPFYDNCKLILAAGWLDESEHAIAGRGLRNVVVTGDPLMFEIGKMQRHFDSSTLIQRVLWAPHWTRTWVDGTRGFATWEWVVLELYRFFRVHRGVELVVRPHPHLNFEAANPIARYSARKLLSLPNVSLSEVSMRKDIARADVLISDGVSILAYFGLTGKPIFVVQNEKTDPPFSELGQEIVAQMRHVRSRKGIARLLRTFVAPSDEFLPDTNPARDRILESFPIRSMSPGKFLVDNL